VFLLDNKMFYGINSYNTCSNAVFRHWHSPTIVYWLPCRWYVVRSQPRNPLFRCQIAAVVMETTQL